LPIASLSIGRELAGERVVDIASVPYAQPYNNDILPASDIGSYFADGVLGGSMGAESRCHGLACSEMGGDSTTAELADEPARIRTA
jgi:hypothetical protein